MVIGNNGYRKDLEINWGGPEYFVQYFYRNTCIGKLVQEYLEINWGGPEYFVQYFYRNTCIGILV